MLKEKLKYFPLKCGWLKFYIYVLISSLVIFSIIYDLLLLFQGKPPDIYLLPDLLLIVLGFTVVFSFIRYLNRFSFYANIAFAAYFMLIVIWYLVDTSIATLNNYYFEASEFISDIIGGIIVILLLGANLFYLIRRRDLFIKSAKQLKTEYEESCLNPRHPAEF